MERHGGFTTGPFSFTEIADDKIEKELLIADYRPKDVGGDVLPFDHLSGFRFELLAYRLQAETTGSDPTCAVTLVKTSGDRARDVLVYERGRLVKIIQCKNQRARLSRPEAMREITKLALHFHSDESLLPAKGSLVGYELWSAGDFSEPAAKLIDEWPSSWDEQEVERTFVELKETYVHFKDLEWLTVRNYLLNYMQSKIYCAKKTPVDITVLVRNSPLVHQQFFVGHIVASMEDVRDVLTEILTKTGMRQISDEDVRHLVDRISSYQKSDRLVFLMAHVLGISQQVFAEMTPNELSQFFTNCSVPIFQNTRLLIDVVLRLGERLQSDFCSRASFKNKNFRMVLKQLVATAILRRARSVGIGKELLADKLFRYAKEDFWEQVQTLCYAVWDQAQEILSPDFALQTTNMGTESLRKQIAKAMIEGFETREALEAELLEDFVRNRQAVKELLEQCEILFPRDFLIVADGRSFLSDKDLMAQFISTLRRIEDQKKRKGNLVD